MEPDTALTHFVDGVRNALATRASVYITGHGSKAFYGGPAVGEPLDMTALAGISSYEPTELVVTARAGTPIDELEAALAEHGQYLAFEPPRFRTDGAAGRGTVGGMVATGLSGPGRASVGAVRDHVLGATLLNGRGECLSFGGQVIKNVAGYDVSRLLCGSLGVLGAILEVSLKVLPLPPATASLRFEIDEAGALTQLATWGGMPLPLNASAWLDGTLAVRLRGARAAVDAALGQLRERGGEPIGDDLAASFWNGLRDQTDGFFAKAHAARASGSGAALWRLSLPQTAPPIVLPGEQLIEWHGAQRWWCTPAPAAAVRDAAQRVGGHATLFRGGAMAGTAGTADSASAGRGASVSPDAFAPLSEPLMRIHRALKREFDPADVFNRGRLYPDL